MSTTGPTGPQPPADITEAEIKLYMSTNPGSTREDAIAFYNQFRAKPTAPTGADGGTPSRTFQTQRSATTYTRQQVDGFARSIAQNAIGRTLSDDEWTQLTRSVNFASKKNPTISSSVTNRSGSGTSLTSFSNRGGLDQQQFVQAKLEQSDEYAAYQKATTYFDSMMSALRGPAGGGI